MKLFLTLSSLCIVLFSQTAAAHVLIRSDQQNRAALLHIMPDDSPVTGQSADLFFDVQGMKLTTDTRATLTIDATPVKTTIKQQVVSAQYVFPRQGTYHMTLRIAQNGQPDASFSLQQRVTRGTLGSYADQQLPAWAEFGSIFSFIGLVVLIILCWNNRHEIRQNSRLDKK